MPARSIDVRVRYKVGTELKKVGAVIECPHCQKPAVPLGASENGVDLFGHLYHGHLKQRAAWVSRYWEYCPGGMKS